MLISLHKQAPTTPKIRAAVQASSEPARVYVIIRDEQRNLSSSSEPRAVLYYRPR